MSELISLPDGFALPVTGKQADYPELPWTTGPRPFAHRHALEAIDGADPTSANRQALEALMHGASSLLFWVHRAEDLPTLLKDVRLDIAPVHLVYGGMIEDLSNQLRALPSSQHPEALHGSINLDPAEHRFRTRTSWVWQPGVGFGAGVQSLGTPEWPSGPLRKWRSNADQHPGVVVHRATCLWLGIPFCPTRPRRLGIC